MVDELFQIFNSHVSTVSTQAISIGAALIALVAALASWRSSNASRATLAMAKTEFAERHDSIRVYLVDGVAQKTRGEAELVSFAITYTNAANAPNTIVRIELHVYALNSEGAEVKSILDPSPENPPILYGYQKLGVPLNLGARVTSSGWVSFSLPRHILQFQRVEKYEVRAITSNDKVVSIETYIIRAIENEEIPSP